MQLHLLAFLDAILEKHIRLHPDQISGKSVPSHIYYVKLRLLRICCQSPGSSRASAGSFIATFSSGYRLRQEQTVTRTHARTSQGRSGRQHVAFCFGCTWAACKSGAKLMNSQVHLQGLLARGSAEATVQDDWPVHRIALCGHMLVTGSAHACRTDIVAERVARAPRGGRASRHMGARAPAPKISFHHLSPHSTHP